MTKRIDFDKLPKMNIIEEIHINGTWYLIEYNDKIYPKQHYLYSIKIINKNNKNNHIKELHQCPFYTKEDALEAFNNDIKL